MITKSEQIIGILLGMQPADVRSAIRTWGKVVVKKLNTRREYLSENGFEEINIEELTSEYLTQDGRAVPAFPGARATRPRATSSDGSNGSP